MKLYNPYCKLRMTHGKLLKINLLTVTQKCCLALHRSRDLWRKIHIQADLVKTTFVVLIASGQMKFTTMQLVWTRTPLIP